MRVIALLFALALPVLAGAESVAKPTATYEEGKDYRIIPNQPKPASTGKIKVTEFFWYGCGHCYDFEPLLEKWKPTLADDVKFVGSPAMWRDMMTKHAKLYYTASAMGVLPKLHGAFFEAMHRKNMRLTDDVEIKKLVSDHGVDGDLFLKTMDSFAVNAQVSQADKRQKTFGVTGTPQMVVGDYYFIEASDDKNKSGKEKQQAMLEVADYLINKIRKER